MQQYFLNEELNVESTYELSKDDSNHIVRIMRKKINDKVYVVFNNEVKYICNIIDNNIDKYKNKMEDKKGFVLRYMILEDLAEFNSNKEDADSRRAVFLLLWLIRAIFILIEILPTIVKIVTPIGAYDRALFQREKDMEKELQESSEKYLQQQAIFREMDYKAQEEQKKKQTEIEQKLQSETLEEIMQVQKNIIQKKIENYKSKHSS